MQSTHADTKETQDKPITYNRKQKDWTLEVRVQWGDTTIDISHYAQPRLVTMGAHELNDFRVTSEAFGEQNVPLVVPTKEQSGYGIFWLDGYQGRYTTDASNGAAKELVEAPKTRTQHRGIQGNITPLFPGEELQLKMGELAIDIRFVERDTQQQASRSKKVDYLFWRLTSFSAIAHMALILAFQFTPTGNQGLHHEIRNNRFRSLVAIPELPSKKAKKIFQIKKPKAPKKQPVQKTRPTNRETTNTKRVVTKQSRVKRAGVLGLLNDQMGSSGTGSLFGKINQNWLPGKVLGTSTAGAAGFGIGTGRCFGTNCNGGGGNGGNLLGGGGVWGNPNNGQYSRKRIKMKTGRTTKSRVLLVVPKINLQGSLSREEIARVVQRNMFAIKFCYERQLRKIPKLEGRIMLKWIIGSTGHVQTATVINTTMNNERVENCLVRRVVRWKFPQPRGNGGIVVVKYPFSFRQAR